MTQYKLTYFDMKGRAEGIRIIFALADVPYIDNRLSFPEFGALKSSLPYGQVPILEFDGITLSQTAAISRFLAKKFGLHGANELEAAKIDEICDALKDYGDALSAVRHVKEGEEEKKAAAIKNLTEVATPKYLGKFSEILKANGGKYFVGKKVSSADIMLFSVLEFFSAASGMDLTKGFPALQTFSKEFAEIPNVKKWLEKRPKTQM